MPLTHTVVERKHEPMPKLKARALKEGDKVALVSPASRPQSAQVMRQCVQVIEQMGLKPVVGPNAMNAHGFLAGEDEERLADLNDFIADETISAIFCATGGFGSLHLLPHLNYEALIKSPKVVAGCDDNTALLNAISNRTGLVTFHAPNLDQITTRFTLDRMKAMLMSSSVPQPISVHDRPCEELVFDCYSPVAGNAEGHLTGGNLTAFVSLLGTPFEPHMAHAILFFEDKNEQWGILDRWMTTLYIGGFITSASGVVFGAFENCGGKGSLNMLPIEDTFGDRLRALNKVSCFGMPFGQTKNTSIIPINARAALDTQRGRLEFKEPVLT